MSSESQSIPQSLVRRITSLGNSQRQNLSESPEDIRGPLGLRVQHDPKDPFVEFVFVHGFPGGSRKTWSYTDESTNFWPKEWLPHEPGFSHVRIHTFGFDADWLDRRGEVTRINHVGKLLLDSIANNAYFRKNEINSIVFVAHSLGGLVVKKAVNEAKQNRTYDALARRFHTFFFLGTPHHGLNSVMVKNILRAGGSEARNHHVNDVDPNFVIVAEDINQGFQAHCQGMRIVSFYETMPSLAGTQTLLVTHHNANLNVQNHESSPLMADHHGLAKFAGSSDSAYQMLRDALNATVEDISGEFQNPEKIQSQMRLIAEYLDVYDFEEEEMSSLDVVPDTCTWLVEKESFIKWRDYTKRDSRQDLDLPQRFSRLQTGGVLRDRSRDVPRVYWLHGHAGCGKSHLAAYAVRHLESFGPCSFYFLKHTDRSKQSLGSLLRSLAFQMASQDVALRRALLSMQQEGSLTAEIQDVRVLWKQLFVQTIFKTGFQQRQFWVIDALDESIGGHELIKLFEKIPPHLPLRIFITSRHDPQMEKDMRRQWVVAESIEAEHTLHDIRLFLEENRDCIHVDLAGVENIIDELVHKSRASFLWARLILERLDNVYNSKAIPKVIREIPDDMNELYLRVVQEMSRKPNKDLAKAILRWTICSRRSLTAAELQEAIQRDIDDSVPMIEQMISDVCSQLVVIEKGGKVRLVHDTARDFLLSKDLRSDFAIDKVAAHGRVAEVCLRYLIDGSAGQLPKRIIGRSSQPVHPAIHEYAHLYFSDHIVRGPSADTGAIDRVCEFLDSKILHTVEYIAREHDIHHLTQIAKNLAAWIDRRSDDSPLTSDMKFVRNWAVDLIRLVTVFGRHILRDPNCIHTVIPCLCPPNTEIYKRYGSRSLGMEVVGLSSRGWTDRIFSAPFPDDHFSALTCSETRYAVGLRSGIVVVYDASTCREIMRLANKTAVKKLVISTMNDWILVGEVQRLTLWNYKSGDRLWTVQIQSAGVDMSFFEEDSVIVMATRSNHIVTHNASDGSVISKTSWHSADSSNRDVRPPMQVFMCNELGLVAVVYRYQPLWLLDLTNLARPRHFGGQSTITALAFNPALKMLVVAFLDGEVCTIGLSSLQKEAHSFVDVDRLIVSGDGKTLAMARKNGTISIHDFETLSELYSISYEDEDIMSLVFSPNGLQILDVRRKEFNVWEPPALYRRRDNEDSGSQGRTSFGTALTEQYQKPLNADSSSVQAIACHHTGDYIFCGKADGTVAVHSALNGKLVKQLFTHDNMGVLSVEWNAATETLITSDTSNQVMAHKVRVTQIRTAAGLKPSWQVLQIFRRRIQSNIRQIISGIDGEYIMVADQDGENLWTLQGDDRIRHQCKHPKAWGRTTSQRWTTHPRYKTRMYEVESHGVHVASWSAGSDALPKIETVPTRPDERVDFETPNYGVHFVKLGQSASGQIMWAAYDDHDLTGPLVWETSASPKPESVTYDYLERFTQISPEVQRLVGLYRSLLIFVNFEGWLCSLSVDGQRSGSKLYTHHFPVPHCWQSMSRRMIASVTSKGDVVIVRYNELAIVKRGLNLYSMS